MYNLFVFEKKIKEEKEKIQKEEKEKMDLEKKSKSELISEAQRDLLKENYEKRVKKFIFNMIEKPVVIQDYCDPIECFKKENLYKLTEKSLNNSKNISRNNVDNTSIGKSSINKSPKSLHSRNVFSLQNRNANSIYNEKSHRDNLLKKNLIKHPEDEKTLRSELIIPKLNLHSPRLIDDFIHEVEDNTENSKEIKKSRNKRTYDNLRKVHTKSVLIQNKTHFKAASDFAIFDKNSSKKPIGENSSFNVRTEDPYYSLDKEESTKESHNIFNLKNLSIKEINKDMIMKNPLIFRLKDEVEVDKERLEKLKKLTLRSTLDKDEIKIANKSNILNILKLPKKDGRKNTKMNFFKGFLGEVDFNHIMDENKMTVKIDNEEFLVSDTQKIAQKILTSCNYFRKKTTSGNNTGRSIVSTKSASVVKNNI